MEATRAPNVGDSVRSAALQRQRYPRPQAQCSSGSNAPRIVEIDRAEAAQSSTEPFRPASETARQLAQEALSRRPPPEDDDLCDRLLWVSYEPLKREILGAMPRLWWFMVDWFHVVRDRFAMEDPLRMDSHEPAKLGRDEHDDDWWIDVCITKDKPGSEEARQATVVGTNVTARQYAEAFDYLWMHQDRRYKMMREAIILQSIMALVDYHAWLDAFLHASRFQPPKFLHLNPRDKWTEKTKLPRKFVVSFPRDTEPEEYEWFFLKDFFRAGAYTDHFMPAFDQLATIATAQGVDVNTIDAIPIKLRFAPAHGGYLRQLAILRNITELISEIHNVEQSWRQSCRRVGTSAAPPVFRLECIDLDLRAFTMYPPVMKAIEKLVVTANTRVASLTLPQTPFDGYVETAKLRTAWASQLVAFFGLQDPVDNNKQHQLTQIDRLVVPQVYMASQYCAPVFMAARDARTVKSLTIEMGDRLARRHRGRDTVFGALIGYAFFSKTSRSSIETLDIGRIACSVFFMETLIEVGRADDPLGSLWEHLTGSDMPQASPLMKPITIKRGSILKPPTGIADIKLHAPWTGWVLFDDPSERVMHVYLPGFGLCGVDRMSVPNKKQRTASSGCSTADKSPSRLRQLRNLVLSLWPEHPDDDANDDDDDHNLNYMEEAPDVLETMSGLLGDTIQSLSVTSEDFDEPTMKRVLTTFKKLERLEFVGGHFDDVGLIMDGLRAARSLSSLNLRKANLSNGNLARFIEHLSTVDSVTSKLRRVGFGKFPDRTLHPVVTDAIADLLRYNRLLTHVHVHTSRPHAWLKLAGHNGEKIPCGPVPLRHRLAFCSVVHVLVKSNAAFTQMLNEFVMGSILRYAAPMQNRTVIIGGSA